MSALIQRLREEHGAIASLLARVREEGAATGAARRLLEQLREEVERHFAAEERLWPRLRASAGDDPRLRAHVEILAREAAELTRETAGFFLRARQGASGLELARDFGRLYAALVSRMRREEETLFPTLEREDGRAGAARPSGDD